MNDHDTRPQVQVCLISGQLLPNLIPVLMDRPVHVHLVVSEDMQAESRRFQKLLQRYTIPYTVHSGVPSTGLGQLLDYATQLASQLEADHPGQSIVLNATGGTKLMALAFVEVFRDLLQAEVIYTDTEHGCLESLTDRDHPQRPMRAVLDIDTYLAANGMTLRAATSRDALWVDRATRRKPLTKWLGERAGSLSDFLGALNTLASVAIDRDGILVRPRQSFERPPHGRWYEALEAIRPHELIEWDRGIELAFHDGEAARYLGGGWLEEYAWHIVRDERPDDVLAGVEGTWEGNRRRASRNEFDLLVVHRNRMLVIECKTLRFGKSESKDQDIMHKLESLGRNAGGLFGRTLLLSARELTPDARARAKSYHIDVIEGGGLSDLRDYVRRWMSAAG